MSSEKRVKTIGIVSLSSGILGEPFIKHELDRGVRRLEEDGLRVKFLPHALAGLEYVQAHPEERAGDLLQAFADPEIDMVLCAVGGDDTYRLLPALFEDGALQRVVTDKIFLGFSDTTLNHFMLHKVGLSTFYGQAFLPDVCELGPEMLPYTGGFFKELIRTGSIREITPSSVWYRERESYDESQTDVPLPELVNGGFRLLQGPGQFSGKILGGCIDSMYDMFDGERYADMPALCRKYDLFPAADEWQGRILLLESSEERPSPEKYERALRFLKDAGVFGAVSGVLAGKPMNEVHAAEYERLLVQVIDDPSLPILTNLSIGHALPRSIIPFGVPAAVDAEAQKITFES